MAHFSRDELHHTRMGGSSAEKMATGFAFEERQFEEHRHLFAFWNDVQCLLHELLRISIWRVGHDVAIPCQIVYGKKIRHLAVASIYQVSAHHFISGRLQHLADMPFAARGLQNPACESLPPLKAK